MIPRQQARFGMVAASGVISGIIVALNIDVIVPFIERLFGCNFNKEIYAVISNFLPSDLHWGHRLGNRRYRRGLSSIFGDNLSELAQFALNRRRHCDMSKKDMKDWRSAIKTRRKQCLNAANCPRLWRRRNGCASFT